MIQRIEAGIHGFSEYLISGKSNKNPWSREEKDIVVPLQGNLSFFKKVEDFLIKTKGYTTNYLRLVLSFSKKDELNLESLDFSNKMNILTSLVRDCREHHANGYENREIISYAEIHKPRILFTPDGKERHEHIHVGIMQYNPHTDTKLKTNFSKNNYINKVFQRYIKLKYNFTEPIMKQGRQVNNAFIKEIKNMSISDLEGILNNYYMNRLEQINKRRNNDFSRNLDRKYGKIEMLNLRDDLGELKEAKVEREILSEKSRPTNLIDSYSLVCEHSRELGEEVVSESVLGFEGPNF